MLFAYSIYLSVTSNWWFFILGFIAWRVLWKANKKGTSENLLDAALVDEEFYEKVLSLNGWSYLTEEQFSRELQQSSIEVRSLAEKILSSEDKEINLSICEDLINKSGYTVTNLNSMYEVETDECILESDIPELIRIARVIATKIIKNKFVLSASEFWGE